MSRFRWEIETLRNRNFVEKSKFRWEVEISREIEISLKNRNYVADELKFCLTRKKHIDSISRRNFDFSTKFQRDTWIGHYIVRNENWCLLSVSFLYCSTTCYTTSRYFFSEMVQIGKKKRVDFSCFFEHLFKILSLFSNFIHLIIKLQLTALYYSVVDGIFS